VNAPDPAECFVELRTLLHEGRLDLPEHARLRSQLREVLSKPMPGGGTQIVSPKKADGSHGDLVSALSRAAWKALQGNGPTPRPRTRPAPNRPVLG
jgi:hypothetical protein